MDLARAPRRAARKKGSGYENGRLPITHPRPQGPGDDEDADYRVIDTA